jgi:hypothetical protein
MLGQYSTKVTQAEKFILVFPQDWISLYLNFYILIFYVYTIFYFDILNLIRSFNLKIKVVAVLISRIILLLNF